MKATALINPMSGSVGPDGVERMKDALERCGLANAQVVALEPDDVERQIADHLMVRSDMTIVWGGDGTLRAALGLADPSQDRASLLLLPGGTMNLLVRWLHGEGAWDEILQAVIASPVERDLPAGQVGDHRFYCAMLAGAPAAFAEARESLRRGDFIDGMVKSGEALEAIETMHLRARFCRGFAFMGETLPETSVVGAMVGPMSPDGGMLVGALIDPSRIAALDVAWKSLISDWRESPSVRIVPANTLHIDRDDGEPIPAVLDGETMELDGAIQVTYLEKAATCLTAA